MYGGPGPRVTVTVTVAVPEAAFMRRHRAPRRGMEARDLVAAAGRRASGRRGRGPSSSGSEQLERVA